MKPKRDANRDYGKGYQYTNVYLPKPGHIVHIVHLDPNVSYGATGKFRWHTYNTTSKGKRKVAKYEGDNLRRA